MGRIFVETAAICGKTIETFGPTVRIFGKMTVPCDKDGNSCSRMSTPGPVPHSSNRIGRISVTTDKIAKAIVEIYELIAKTGEEIVRMFEPITGICNRIVKIDGQTARMFKATIHNGQVTGGSAFGSSSDGVRRGVS
jgi:hypothetical protein